jgi:hypothetical protein
VVGVLAVVAVAIYLVPVGAHLFELPNKIGLPPEQYMIVQRVYSGWALFGIAIVAALVLTLWHARLVRSSPRAFKLALVAFACLAATQAIFWTLTYPVNVASANWTSMPASFEAARRQWEYSHAASAILTFAAFLAILLSVARAARDTAAAGLRSGTAGGGAG